MPTATYKFREGYGYGFNGQEKDEEVKGQGNSYDYKNRIQDPRLGRFLSIDQKFKDYPWYTPYQFAGNDVIRNADLDGLEPDSKFDRLFLGQGMTIELKNQNKIIAEQSINAITTAAKTVAKGFNNVVANGPFPEAGKRGDQFINSIKGNAVDRFEGPTGFSDNGGKELFIGALTLPISIISTVATAGFNIPTAIGIAGIVNTADDFTNDGNSTAIEKLIPGGGVLKTGINIANFGSNTVNLVGNAATNIPSTLGFTFDLTNTVISEGQAIQSVFQQTATQKSSDTQSSKGQTTTPPASKVSKPKENKGKKSPKGGVPSF